MEPVSDQFVPTAEWLRHPQLLRRAETFLLVVDPQEPLVSIIWERDRLIRNLTILIRAAGVLDIPVVVTVQNRDRLGDLIPEVRACLPDGHPVYNKMTFSCLGDDQIRAAIGKLNRRQTLICGVETHVCVHQTAHDLLAAGYEPHVVADAVSSRAQSNWTLGLSRMERAGIIMTSTEMALYEIMERAGTDEFRSVLPLVR